MSLLLLSLKLFANSANHKVIDGVAIAIGVGVSVVNAPAPRSALAPEESWRRVVGCHWD